jgi:hypothetical protein
MKRSAALMLLLATGCLHGGFHQFALPSSAFHAASAATAVAAVPRVHLAPIAVAAAEVASDAFQVAADVAAVEQSRSVIAADEDEGTPYRQLRWAASVVALASGGDCPGLSNVPTDGAILFRNAPVTLYVLSNEPLDVIVTATGPVRWTRDGIALTFTPAGRLGETVHIEVFDNASQVKLEHDLPTIDADVPCAGERHPLGE